MAMLIVKNVGMTAGDLRGSLRSPSARKESLHLVTVDGQSIPFSVDDQNSVQALSQYEKPALLAKQARGELHGSLKDTSKRYPRVQEWDHVVISLDRDETAALTARGGVQDLLEAIQGAAPVTGEGRQQMIISEPHLDTGNTHIHIWIHRHPVDMGKKTVAPSRKLAGTVDQKYGDRSTIADLAERINSALKARDLPTIIDARMSDGPSIYDSQGVTATAQAAAAQLVEDAGGTAGPVLQPGPNPRQATRVASPEVERIMKLASQKQAEAARLMQEAEQAATDAALAQHAAEALMQRDEALVARDEATATAEAASESADRMVDIVDSLYDQARAASTALSTTRAALADATTALSEVEEALDLADLPPHVAALSAFDRIDWIETERKTLAAQVPGLQASLQTAQAALEAEQTARATAETERADLQKRYEDLEAALQAKSAALTEVENAHADALTRIEVLENRAQTAEDKHAKTVEKLTEETRERTQLERLYAAAQETIKDLTQRLSTALESIPERVKAAVDEVRSTLGAEHKRLEERHAEALKEQREQFQERLAEQARMFEKQQAKTEAQTDALQKRLDTLTRNQAHEREQLIRALQAATGGSLVPPQTPVPADTLPGLENLDKPRPSEAAKPEDKPEGEPGEPGNDSPSR